MKDITVAGSIREFRGQVNQPRTLAPCTGDRVTDGIGLPSGELRSGTRRQLNEAIANIKGQVCHCTHVDTHSTWLEGLQLQVDSLAESYHAPTATSRLLGGDLADHAARSQAEQERQEHTMQSAQLAPEAGATAHMWTAYSTTSTCLTGLCAQCRISLHL